ncbi:MAG: domain S-box [Myxococcaceae bacterium]|nr:domain S-box [Myxococcaceae bacterium]
MTPLQVRDGELADSEARLRRLLDRYESLILAIAQIIWTQNPEGQMVGEQASWAAYTGQPPAEYQHQGWLAAVHPDDRGENLRLWEHAIAAREPFEFEHRLRRHDGAYRYFSVRAVPVFADDGAIREWVGVHTDITRRKLADEELRRSERSFRDLAESMPQIVWGASADGCFDYYNRRWYEFTGRPGGASGDDSWADAVHPDDRAQCLALWHSAIAAGEAYEVEYRLRGRDGEYAWHLRRALPVRDEAGAITRWFGTCTDIDARKRAEDQLRVSALRLSQSNRELQDFASVASHDLQEPLRKIQSFADSLKEEHAAALDDEGRDYLDRIQATAQRMRTLINDLLTFSRVSSQAQPLRPVDLNRVAREVLSDLEARLRESGGRVDVAELPTVTSDPTQMRQLLQNLIGNALKFHRAGEAPAVRVSAEVRDGTVLLSVADRGIGFDEKYLDRVFKIFQRLHGRGEYEGTGIGLAICRKIVERHGGTLTARSRPGEGATFVASLPLAQPQGEPDGA